MELFVEIVNAIQSVAIFAKSSILDVWLGSEYAYASPALLCVLTGRIPLMNTEYFEYQS